jgi:hypothetical protein
MHESNASLFQQNISTKNIMYRLSFVSAEIRLVLCSWYSTLLQYDSELYNPSNQFKYAYIMRIITVKSEALTLTIYIQNIGVTSRQIQPADYQLRVKSCIIKMFIIFINHLVYLK